MGRDETFQRVQPPDGDALDGTCRGSVEPLVEGGSPRTGHNKPEYISIPPAENLEPGELVWMWSVITERWIPLTVLCEVKGLLPKWKMYELQRVETGHILRQSHGQLRRLRI